MLKGQSRTEAKSVIPMQFVGYRSRLGNRALGLINNTAPKQKRIFGYRGKKDLGRLETYAAYWMRQPGNSSKPSVGVAWSFRWIGPASLATRKKELKMTDLEEKQP